MKVEGDQPVLSSFKTNRDLGNSEQLDFSASGCDTWVASFGVNGAAKAASGNGVTFDGTGSLTAAPCHTLGAPASCIELLGPMLH